MNSTPVETRRRQEPGRDEAHPPLVLGAFAVRQESVVHRPRYRGEQDTLPSELQTQQSPVILRAELARAPEELYAENENLQTQNATLRAQVQELRQSLGASENSHPGGNFNSRQRTLASFVDASIHRTSLPIVQATTSSEDASQQEHQHAAERQSLSLCSTTVDDDKREQRGKKRDVYKALGIVVILVVIGVGVAVPVSNRSKASDSSDNNDNTPPSITVSPTMADSDPKKTTAPAVLTKEPTVAPTARPTSIAPISPSNPPLTNGPWLQLGQNLNGNAVGDHFGRSLVLSRDAHVMAVGADQSSQDRGYVSVFRFEVQTRSWTPMGQPLVGEATGDKFGTSVSLNGEGTVLAIGARRNDGGGTDAGHVRVYEYDTANSRWIQRGSDIDGQAPSDRFGSSLSLSNSGDVLAVGAHFSTTNNGEESGSVRVFRYNRGVWEKLGQTLIGNVAGDRFASLSLSSSGLIVGVGAPGNDSGGEEVGQVSVFQYNGGSSTWIPVGVPISGNIANGLFGFSVSLDDSGLVIAVGAPGDTLGSVVGRVMVFDYDSGAAQWIQRGPTLFGEDEDDLFGESVSLSVDGNVMGVGIPTRDSTGLTRSGQVRIFQFNAIARKWIQVGQGLNGEIAFGWFGTSLSLSGNGTVVGVGADGRHPNGLEGSGYVKVFTRN